MKFHPLADIFPLMGGREFDDLVASIKEHGLRNPITIYEDKILDGRNRWRACQKAKREPDTKQFRGKDPIAFVIDQNINRRHLDESQRAMVAARLSTYGHGGDRSKLPIGNLTGKDAADRLNVGRRSVSRAQIVIDQGIPELNQAVISGLIPVSVAATLAKMSPSVQAKAVENPERAKVFAKQAKRTVREKELGIKQRDLPDSQYGVILADPEWQYNPYSRETGMDRAADNHYPTSVTAEIAARDASKIAAKDCVLFLWATTPMLLDAIQTLESWGFKYVSHYIWDKETVEKGKTGTGFWNRNAHELLLIGTRGNPPCPAQGKQWSSVIREKPTKHSAKPEKSYQMIEEYYPTMPKIELNARKARPGWDVWGNEAPVAEAAE